MANFFHRAAGAIVAPFLYAKREVQHLKEGLKEDAQDMLANVLKLVAIGLVGLMFLIFLSITIAVAISEATGNGFLGFAIVAGFYLLAGIGLYIWKQSQEKKTPFDNTRKAVNLPS